MVEYLKKCSNNADPFACFLGHDYVAFPAAEAGFPISDIFEYFCKINKRKMQKIVY